MPWNTVSCCSGRYICSGAVVLASPIQVFGGCSSRWLNLPLVRWIPFTLLVLESIDSRWLLPCTMFVIVIRYIWHEAVSSKLKVGLDWNQIRCLLDTRKVIEAEQKHVIRAPGDYILGGFVEGIQWDVKRNLLNLANIWQCHHVFWR